ncbi:RICIN domain-containing protein [Microtetraspora fusca]|uniref:RICIN domain-containing protein n=1 Tax=Microtetraspora fusca TaxID=1997 RepID=UPI00082F54CD|nr:RICIN domain-containing protein [Microtetraspora fusca]
MAIPARAYLINKKSGLAIDIEYANPDEGARALQWTPNGNANQRFELRPTTRPAGLPPDYGYHLIAEHSGKALSAHPNWPEDVQQYNLYAPDKAMRFYLKEVAEGGFYRIVSQYPPGKVLAVKGGSTDPGARLVQVDLVNSYPDADSQLWQIQAAP